MRERFCIGITVRAIDGGGSWLLLKPLQQRFRLRMIRSAGNVNREAWIRKHLDRIAGLKIVLARAGFAGELPCGNQVIDERIVERLRDFMAERGHVLKPGDVLTLGKGADVIAIRVLALAERRGPASEARSLYEVLE